MRRRRYTFGPSLAMSACLNALLFAGLQPIRVERAEPARVQLRRLTRMATHEAMVTPTTPVATPLAANIAKPLPPRPRPNSASATLRVASGTRPNAAAGRPGANAPVVSAAWKPSDRRSPGQPVGPTGGDGTRAVPTGPKAGAGDLPTALAMEPGQLNGPQNVPALGGMAGLQAPRAGLAMLRPGPPVVFPGAGDRGGTPMAPNLGGAPLPGTAGSGDNPYELAPRSVAGWTKPLAPTTEGYRLTELGGHGLPTLRGGLPLPGMPVDPDGRSGGGGGTAAVVGPGGGGPLQLAGAPRELNRGGGGSGMVINTGVPGGTVIGPGPGGTGGGGNGFAPVGGGSGMPGGSLYSLAPAMTTGVPSVLAQIGRGDPSAPSVRPGARMGGPGGAPVDIDPSLARGNTSPGTNPGGGGGGQPGGNNGAAGTVVATRSGDGDGRPTGVIIDTMALNWHHYPGSFDLYVGSASGARLATIGVVHYRSVASARAGSQMVDNGRREPLLIRPLAIEFVAKDGQGARQRVVISSSDAAALRKSGMLSQPSRIVTVWKGNIRSD